MSSNKNKETIDTSNRLASERSPLDQDAELVFVGSIPTPKKKKGSRPAASGPPVPTPDAFRRRSAAATQIRALTDANRTLAENLREVDAIYLGTDGQTERQNQTLEQYLRCYINYQQDDWVYWLPMAEYAYNNSIHATTEMSPFSDMFAEVPKWEDALAEAREDEVPAARKRAENLIGIRTSLEARLAEAAQTQAKYYNRKHLPKTYNVGDKVVLNIKNIKSTKPSSIEMKTGNYTAVAYAFCHPPRFLR